MVGRGRAVTVPPLLSVLVLLALLAAPADAWQEWTWNGEGPGTRGGHSLHVYKDSVFLFGGRGTDLEVPHQPRTYEIAENDGVLSFNTYDQRLVKDCGNDTTLACLNITIGLYHNDVWEYQLDCDRYDDFECAFQGWIPFHRGAPLGGCELINQLEFCTHPSERYDHASTIFSDGTLVVYGGFSRRCEDFCSDLWTLDLEACADPAQRCLWRERAVLGREGPGKRWRAATTDHGNATWYLFGGHRMWHGLAQRNSVENRWSDTTQFQHGGYLDDLWRYDLTSNTWTQLLPKQSCFLFPGEAWEDRQDFTCNLFWPGMRADAVLLLAQDMLWLHGGYRTAYPHPHVSGRGAGNGTARVTGRGELAPYPTLPFYLDDLWRYNFTSGLWEEITPATTINPAARRGHSMIVSGQVFLLVGGYATNFFYEDFWIYNLTTNSWLEKSTFVHPLLPDTCTDDTLKADGTQSVFGVPTRFTETDGEFGRADAPVQVYQQRRARPGWDGCRDRVDGRDKRDPPDYYSLPNEMVWKRPSQRSKHRVAYHEGYGLMLLYGGDSFLVPQLPEVDVTFASDVIGDFWTYNINKCPLNCSDHGSCFYGFCFCDNGWYGVDCSNSSCPGDYCYYDPVTHKQVCEHCCHASYEHTDGELYVTNERKVACDANHPGESHGICDGFGRCQCAPPFIGEDCAIKDCPRNCSGHGWCSVEYPVSRCMCDEKFGGLDCSEQLCLNDCSPPNGECVDGVCECVYLLNPYNRTQTWRKWQGLDCSYLIPFAGASQATPSVAVAGLVVVAALWQVAGWGNADNDDVEERQRRRRRRR